MNSDYLESERGSGSIAKVASEHLRWGFLEKYWLQGCKFWGTFLVVIGN